MPTLSRPPDPRHGATVWIKVMQSPAYVDVLKKAGLKDATPISIIGILGVKRDFIYSAAVGAV